MFQLLQRLRQSSVDFSRNSISLVSFYAKVLDIDREIGSLLERLRKQREILTIHSTYNKLQKSTDKNEEGALLRIV